MYSASYCVLFILYILYSAVCCLKFCTVLFTVNIFSILEGSLGGQLLNLPLEPETDVSLWSHQQDCGRQLWGGAGPFGVECSLV